MTAAIDGGGGGGGGGDSGGRKVQGEVAAERCQQRTGSGRHREGGQRGRKARTPAAIDGGDGGGGGGGKVQGEVRIGAAERCRSERWNDDRWKCGRQTDDDCGTRKGAKTEVVIVTQKRAKQVRGDGQAWWGFFKLLSRVLYIDVCTKLTK